MVFQLIMTGKERPRLRKGIEQKKQNLKSAFLMLIIGTLRSDDGDGNENVVKVIGLPVISKTTTLHVHHTFLYISLPHFMFYTGRKQATTKFSFSFMTCIRQLEIQL